MNALGTNLFTRAEQARIAAHPKDDDKGLDAFRTALRSYARGEAALSVALERAGLPAQPQRMNSALTYAGRQLEGMGDTVSSIKQMADGRKYVEVDTDQHIFDGAKEADYPRIARNYIRQNFIGTTIPLSNGNAKITGRSAHEYTYPANRRLRNDIKQTKLRAAPELLNMLQVAEHVEHSENKRNHEEATGGWDYYKTVFKLGERWFEGLVNVMNQEDFSLFYDITKIRDITHQDWLFDQGSIHQGKSNASNTSISTDGGNVNTKFSLRSDEDGLGFL